MKNSRIFTKMGKEIHPESIHFDGPHPKLPIGLTRGLPRQLSTLRELQWAQLCCVRNMTQERKNQMRLASPGEICGQVHIGRDTVSCHRMQCAYESRIRRLPLGSVGSVAYS